MAWNLDVDLDFLDPCFAGLYFADLFAVGLAFAHLVFADLLNITIVCKG